MLTKAKKDLPEVKTVLDVVFAGHLQIILIGEAEFQLVLHSVDLALERVAGVPQAEGMWVYSNSPKGVEIAVLQISSG